MVDVDDDEMPPLEGEDEDEMPPLEGASKQLGLSPSNGTCRLQGPRPIQATTDI